jgi:hypothetical protein
MISTSTIQSTIATTTVLPNQLLMAAHPKLFSSVMCGLLAITGFVSNGLAASGPPAFIQVPADRVAYEGERVTFQAAIVGAAPIVFQWFQNDQPVPGATGPSFVLPQVGLRDDGAVFSVSASNALGQTNSPNAVLSVKAGIVVTPSVNDAAQATVPRGWPLILDVGLLHPELFASNALPILISSTNGPWANALEIRVLDAQGQLQTWPLHAIAMTNETLLLTDESGGRIRWWLSPQETAQLTNGTYELVVTLQTTNVARPLAWTGLVKSVPVIITMTNEPATLTEENAEEKQGLMTRYALLEGDPVQARQAVAALLTVYPTNIGGLTMSMYLQRDAGQLVEAWHAAQEALAQVYAENPNPAEPPVELMQNLAELQALLTPPHLDFSFSGGQLTLRWQGRSDTQYKLESSDNLTSWAVRSTNFTVTANTYSWTTNMTSPHQFFRVKF